MRSIPLCLKWSKKARYIVVFTLLAGLLVLFLGMNVCIGSVAIQPDIIWKLLLGQKTDDVFYNIVWKMRFPRAVAAAILGGALALSGYLLQTFFHNPIAGPFVLGISSGARLAVTAAMIVFLKNAIGVTSVSLILAAFLGAMLAMGGVLLMSARVRSSSGLVVGGIMIGYICSSITDLLVEFANEDNIVNLHNWSMGGFSGMTWENVAVMAVIVGITFVAVFFMAKPIHAYQLGESYAVSVGVHPGRLRWRLVIYSSILSACVTAFAGPVSFVGIAVPQVVRGLFQTARPIIIIPASFLGGAVFCLFCDLFARVLFAPVELGISVVTAIFGAPVVIFVMLSRKKNQEG